VLMIPQSHFGPLLGYFGVWATLGDLAPSAAKSDVIFLLDRRPRFLIKVTEYHVNLA